MAASAPAASVSPRARAKPASSPGTSPSGPPGKISSVEEADFALAELGRLEADEKRIQAECDKALEGVRTTFAGRMKVLVAGEKVAFADRRQQLLEQLEIWAAANRRELLDGDKKSRDLNHGTIGWRAQIDKLVPADEAAPQGRPSILKAILAHLHKALGTIEPLFVAGTLRFLKVDVAFDKKALLSARQKNEISAGELRDAGFKVESGEDKFFARAKAQDVSAQPTQPQPAGGA